MHSTHVYDDNNNRFHYHITNSIVMMNSLLMTQRIMIMHNMISEETQREGG